MRIRHMKLRIASVDKRKKKKLLLIIDILVSIGFWILEFVIPL